MKDWIDQNYPRHRAQGALHDIIRDAWHTIGRDTIDTLLDSMPARMAAAVATNRLSAVY